ncbi:hypothetical protein JCM19241_5190 [Vibrio ishigakensis]|uniref:2-amino-4-hydroxy-6-hydroxymethyldihydropteridine diphosphokinase n=1 Tax=Vibrio ishigakensis TaxID=1481914 RepID=A0A0B8QH99_9VIBR|nr:hypothetical protein JCM19241_5190 [Vibrio ishigakensis]
MGELAKVLQQIELDSGRQRENKEWASRTLDIDILLYDNKVALSTG